MARPFPQDQVEHELRSLRYHLMAYPQCPPIVRLKTREATFARPSMDIANVTSSPTEDNRYRLSAQRSTNILWWSEEDEETAHSSATAMADFFVKALSRGGEQRMSVLRIYDWSADEPFSLNTFMDVEVSSIDARPVPDEYGFWMTAVDFRYSVEIDWPLPPAPDLEQIKGIVKTVDHPMTITIP